MFSISILKASLIIERFSNEKTNVSEILADPDFQLIINANKYISVFQLQKVQVRVSISS